MRYLTLAEVVELHRRLLERAEIPEPRAASCHLLPFP